MLQKKISLWVVLIVLGINTQSIWASEVDKLYPALKLTDRGNFEGYINEDGNWVVEPSYEMAFDMSDGRGIVSKDGKYGAVDEKGTLVIPLIYDSITPFKEGRAIFVKEDKLGVINTEGSVVADTNYSYIGSYTDGLALVGQTKDDTTTYGYIDRGGREVIPPKYKEASEFIDEKAIVKNQANKYQLIDKKGNVLNTYTYDRVYGYGDGAMIYEENSSGKQGYIDEAGNIIIQAKYELAEPFKDGVAVVGYSPYFLGEQGLINKRGKLIYPMIYTNIKNLGENRIALGIAIDQKHPERGSKYALADTDGGALTEFVFSGIGDFKEGIAYVYNNTVSYFINKSGEKIEAFPYITGSGSLEKVGKNIIQGDLDQVRIYLTDKGSIVFVPNEVIPLADKKEVLVEVFRLDQNYVVFYPRVRGLEDEGIEEDINEKLKEQGIHEDVTAAERAEYTYFSDFSILYYKANLLVIDQRASTYYYGAAHPLPTRKTSVIDLSNGSFYKLNDLFKKDTNWEQQLLKLMEEQKKTSPIKDQVFNDTTLTLDNNYSFYVDEKGLIIYYSPYEIGPYASGYITFNIPYKAIDSLINKEGELWKAYH